MKREVTRSYKMSDARLVQLADSIKSSAHRDLSPLGAYGVQMTTLTDIDAARLAFINNPTDEELSGDMMIATENKNVWKADVQKQVRQIADRARIKYGETNPKFRKFGVDLLSKQNDDELVRTGRRVVRVATEFQPELITEGLTTNMITQLETLINNFDDVIDVQDTKVKDRDIAVDQRITLGNALYALVVTLAAKGKLCWQDTNEAKYNDYILNETNASAGHVTEGNVAANAVVNTSVTGVTAATAFTLTNNGNVPLMFFFAQNATDTTGPNMVNILPGQTQNYSAAALGYNEDGLITRFNVFNSNPAAGSYTVEWI